MGNCICTTPSNPNTTSQAQEHYSEIHETRFEGKKQQRAKHQNERRVEFESKAGGKRVRIKVVLSQQELKQILEYHNGNSKHTSVEELLGSMRRKSRRRSSGDCCKSSGNNKSGWRPALHSIPEET